MNGKKTHRFPLAVRVIIWLVIAGVLLYAGVMGFVVIREKGVANTVPSSDSYDAIIVLGAQGKDEPAPEATVMKQYLTEKGVNEQDILTDPESFNTRQNLENAGKLLKDRPDVQKVLIVTSDYHVPRSLALAKDQGYEATGLGSPCKPEYWLKNHAREALAWIKYWGVKYLHLPLE